jgi:hypothetical protein
LFSCICQDYSPVTPDRCFQLPLIKVTVKALTMGRAHAFTQTGAPYLGVQDPPSSPVTSLNLPTQATAQPVASHPNQLSATSTTNPNITKSRPLRNSNSTLPSSTPKRRYQTTSLEPCKPLSLYDQYPSGLSQPRLTPGDKAQPPSTRDLSNHVLVHLRGVRRMRPRLRTQQWMREDGSMRACHGRPRLHKSFDKDRNT